MLSSNPIKKSLNWLGRQLFNQDNPAAFFDPLVTPINPLWIRGFTPAQVQDIITETADTKTFVLKPTNRWTGFEAGQHVNLSVDIDGVRYTRTFSLSSTPARWIADGTITLTIKRLPGGLVTNWMHDNLKPGTVLGLSKAFGDFLEPQAVEPLLFIAGGSGITPILSLLETLEKNHYRAPVALLYFVRTQADVIGAERLYALRQRWPAFNLQVVYSQEDGEPVYLGEQHLDTIPGIKARLCYLCGPKGLMDLATDLLGKYGISNDRIRVTFFSAPAPVFTGESGGLVTFSRSGKDVEASDGTALLELAEAAKLNPKYGCRMGICHQCKCTKTSGTVVNSLTGKVSSPGEEQIQLCISVPQGPVTIDL